MQLRSLKHILEAVCALVNPRLVTVMGSSSLLVACDASLGDEGQPLELSLAADILLDPTDDAQAAVLHEAVGEGSLFHREYGIYVDLLRPEIEDTLPPGWRERCVTMDGIDHVVALDPYDLAVAKLTVARNKDIELLRGLMQRGLLGFDRLQQRYQDTPMDEKRMFRASRVLGVLRPASDM